MRDLIGIGLVALFMMYVRRGGGAHKVDHAPIHCICVYHLPTSKQNTVQRRTREPRHDSPKASLPPCAQAVNQISMSAHHLILWPSSQFEARHPPHRRPEQQAVAGEWTWRHEAAGSSG